MEKLRGADSTADQHGEAARQPFDHHVAECFLQGGKYKNVRGRVTVFDVIAPAGEHDASRRDRIRPGLVTAEPGVLTDDDQKHLLQPRRLPYRDNPVEPFTPKAATDKQYQW